MGFSFKVAPGVRVRASSRGVRTSIGPRAARLHVGGGRTGVSTGTGPVSFYTSVSGSRPRPRSAGASQRALAQAAKQQQAEEMQAALNNVMNLHRQHFPPSTAPTAPRLPRLDTAAVKAKHEKRALSGIGPFQRTARKDARSTALAAAEQEIAQLEAEQEILQQRRQSQLDLWWRELQHNKPEIVLNVLAEAFEDNDAPGAAVGVIGDEVSLVMVAPDIDTVPERKPDLTPAGNLTLKKLTKAQRGALHSMVVASHVLLTVREALAVAQGLNSARIVVLEHCGLDAFGNARVQPVLAAVFQRRPLDNVQWDRADALSIVRDASTEALMNIHRTTHHLEPLNLGQHPQLAELLDQVETGDLLNRS